MKNLISKRSTYNRQLGTQRKLENSFDITSDTLNDEVNTVLYSTVFTTKFIASDVNLT
jgi:hypothetical protein